MSDAPSDDQAEVTLTTTSEPEPPAEIPPHLVRLNVHQHPNGGGWVDAASQVAGTVYVGPDCLVIASLLHRRLRIEDGTVVMHCQLSQGRVRQSVLHMVDVTQVLEIDLSHLDQVRHGEIEGRLELYRARLERVRIKGNVSLHNASAIGRVRHYASTDYLQIGNVRIRDCVIRPKDHTVANTLIEDGEVTPGDIRLGKMANVGVAFDRPLPVPDERSEQKDADQGPAGTVTLNLPEDAPSPASAAEDDPTPTEPEDNGAEAH